jgi:hypothetical protein
MMSTWLSAAVVLAAIALTFFICVRPHLPRRARAVGLPALRAHHGFAGSSTPLHDALLSRYTDSS